MDLSFILAHHNKALKWHISGVFILCVTLRGSLKEVASTVCHTGKSTVCLKHCCAVPHSAVVCHELLRCSASTMCLKHCLTQVLCSTSSVVCHTVLVCHRASLLSPPPSLCCRDLTGQMARSGARILKRSRLLGMTWKDSDEISSFHENVCILTPLCSADLTGQLQGLADDLEKTT